jgi:type II secretory pathway component GspD/PulD (secretin)
VLSAVAKLPQNFFAVLDGLVTRRQARVRANPRVATISGRRATVFIGVQQYLGTPVTLGEESSSNYIDAGVRLEMTPLTGGGAETAAGQGQAGQTGPAEIILDIQEEISTLSRPEAATGLPTKTTRSSTTVVRVKDGQTIIVGGLRQEEEHTTRRAIPILGKLPLIGGLFRSKETDRTNVDLAVFITARRLSPTGHLPEAEEKEIRDGITMDQEKTTK